MSGVKVVSYNIQFGRGMDHRIDLARVCDLVRDADIICLQEVDQWWKRSGEVDQADEISSLLPGFYYVFGASFNVDASYLGPAGRIVNRRRCQGNMILSRWPVVSTRSFNLPKTHFADKFNMQMVFLESVIDTGSRSIRVYNYHAGYADSGERMIQVDAFAAVFNSSPAEKGAWSGKADIDGDDWSNRQESPELPESAIVCGDFNASPDTDEYSLLLESTGLIDCWSLADPENQNSSTLRKEISQDIRVAGKVDHILVTADMVDNIEQVGIDDAAAGSDHKPVRTILNLAG